MLRMLRHVLVLVTIAAFAGGMTIQASPSAAALGLPGIGQADMPCPYMTAHQQAEQQPTPTRGKDTDCVKQMGCLGTPSLPARSGELAEPVAYSRVTYLLPPM